MQCEKVIFNTKEEAEQELRRIVEETNYKPWKDKKPCRAYQCIHHEEEVWHLTSQPYFN